MLDLYYFCAQIAEDLRAVRAGKNPRHIQHFVALQRERHIVRGDLGKSSAPDAVDRRAHAIGM